MSIADTRTVSDVVLVVLLARLPGTPIAQSIEGAATCRERFAFPPTAVFEAMLEDVSRADALAEAVARTRVAPPGNPPIAFTIAYDPARIIAGHRYGVRARIVLDEKLPFTTDVAAPVISGGSGANVSLMLRRVSTGQTPPHPSGTEGPFRDALKRATRLTVVGDRLELFDATGTRLALFVAGSQTSIPSPSPGLAGTSWQLVKFQGSDDTTLTPDDRGKYTIEFGAGGRLTARVDCNRGRGTWKSTGSHQIEFGPLATTRAKCPAGSCTIRS
jgi:uncharacterized lipoprotein YbaY/heat shock protein HslJ